MRSRNKDVNTPLSWFINQCHSPVTSGPPCTGKFLRQGTRTRLRESKAQGSNVSVSVCPRPQSCARAGSQVYARKEISEHLSLACPADFTYLRGNDTHKRSESEPAKESQVE